jgi:hypothetical protein
MVASTAILDAAVRHHVDDCLTCCAVDFEAFNPEAATFWMRHFTPGVPLADARSRERRERAMIGARSGETASRQPRSR